MVDKNVTAVMPYFHSRTMISHTQMLFSIVFLTAILHNNTPQMNIMQYILHFFTQILFLNRIFLHLHFFLTYCILFQVRLKQLLRHRYNEIPRSKAKCILKDTWVFHPRQPPDIRTSAAARLAARGNKTNYNYNKERYGTYHEGKSNFSLLRRA